jgi:5-methylcytosine-specific restriction endonuclease McrBC regulatory subunit McrC
VTLIEYGPPKAFDDTDGRFAEQLQVLNAALARELGLREAPFLVRQEGRMTSLRVRGICGTVAVGEHILDIAPKFVDPSDESRRWRDSLLNVVSRARRSNTFALPRGAWSRTISPTFVDHVGRMFAAAMQTAHERGPIRLYQNRTERGNAVRGRLLLGPSQLVSALRNPGVLTYAFDELSADNGANALLLWAGRELAAVSRSAATKVAVRGAIARLETLVKSATTPGPRMMQRLPSQYRVYELPLQIASLLRGRFVSNVGGEEHRRYGLVIDTNRTFEAFVERSVEIALDRDAFIVRAQADAVYGRPLHDGSALRTRPDVVVQDAAGRPVLVVDAKYKLPSHRDRLRGTAQDNYQLLTSMLAHGATTGLLLYPGAYDLALPRRWHVDVLGRAHHIAIATIDPGSFGTATGRQRFDARFAAVLRGLLGKQDAA